MVCPGWLQGICLYAARMSSVLRTIRGVSLPSSAQARTTASAARYAKSKPHDAIVSYVYWHELLRDVLASSIHRSFLTKTGCPSSPNIGRPLLSFFCLYP